MAIAKLVTKNAKPHFTHDCEQCKFLGTLDGNDIYTCMQGVLNRKTYIQRFGNEGPSYLTMPPEAVSQIPDGYWGKFAVELEKRNYSKPYGYSTQVENNKDIKY